MLGREWTGVTVIEAKLKKVLLKAEAAGTRYTLTQSCMLLYNHTRLTILRYSYVLAQ
jgi:hypothetical protein